MKRTLGFWLTAVSQNDRRLSNAYFRSLNCPLQSHWSEQQALDRARYQRLRPLPAVFARQPRLYPSAISAARRWARHSRLPRRRRRALVTKENVSLWRRCCDNTSTMSARPHAIFRAATKVAVYQMMEQLPSSEFNYGRDTGQPKLPSHPSQPESLRIHE